MGHSLHSFLPSLTNWPDDNRETNPCILQGVGGFTILPTSSYWLVANMVNESPFKSINNKIKQSQSSGCAELQQHSWQFSHELHANHWEPRGIGSPKYTTAVKLPNSRGLGVKCHRNIQQPAIITILYIPGLMTL